MLKRPTSTSLVSLLSLIITWHIFRSISTKHNAVNHSAADDSTFDANLANREPLVTNTSLHVLLPMDGPNVNLCKLLLGLSYLEYPTPVLVSWGQHGTDLSLIGGGTHLTKISSVHEYLDSLPSSSNNDLVLMLDAVDVWVQLPASVLISRYYAILNSTINAFAYLENGQNTVEAHEIANSIVFGSGKRCARAQYHSIACYPLPESPLPHDLYGANTDSVIGRVPSSSYRQRYLNSGFVMGPVAAMRKMFAEAQRQVETSPVEDPEDSGSGEANRNFRGSDQAVFSKILGRQEWVREALRARWTQGRLRKGLDTRRIWQLGMSKIKPRESWMQGLHVDNVLEPGFTHELMNYTEFEDKPGQFEFGMTLDYWSDIIHQTNLDSEADARWLVMGELDGREPRMAEQIVQAAPRNRFDCPVMKIPQTIPSDLQMAQLAKIPDREYEMLYMHVCLGRIPAFVHRNTIDSNGFKPALKTEWRNVWYVRFGNSTITDIVRTAANTINIQDFKIAPRHIPGIYAWTKAGKQMRWPDLCPNKWDSELFPI